MWGGCLLQEVSTAIEPIPPRAQKHTCAGNSRQGEGEVAGGGGGRDGKNSHFAADTTLLGVGRLRQRSTFVLGMSGTLKEDFKPAPMHSDHS